LVIEYKFVDPPPTPNDFLTYFEPNIKEITSELAQKYNNIPEMLREIDKKLFAPSRSRRVKGSKHTDRGT